MPKRSNAINNYNITTRIIATITATITATVTATTTTITTKSTISYFQMKVGNNFMAVAFAVCNGSMTLQAEKIYLTIINNESKVNNMAKW